MSRSTVRSDLARARFALPAIDKPIIRVLIYTDDPDKIDENGNFGIAEFRRHLAAHPPAFATIDLKPLVSRNSGPRPNQHADHKIDDELTRNPKEPYHEVWFFGLHQANKTKYRLKFPGGGGPHSELESDEIAALDDWMRIDQDDGSKGIGVLISGDHANPPPDKQVMSGSTKFCPPDLDHQEFLGLGRALGKHVPRAGLLRKWEGPPTHCEEDSLNTLFPPPQEIDALPQQLILPKFDQHGNPDPTGKPHPIFQGINGEWIQVLPDHEHEGMVILPDDFPENIWRAQGNVKPVPRYIAFGTDHRTGSTLNIFAAYDGNAVGLGRIISDSSWHHYFNANLNCLSASDLNVPAADQIGQLYSNLVLWLAPLETRYAMAKAMFRWLANHPRMIEEISAGVLNIGNVALKLLRQVASDCEINELLLAACPEQLRQQYETFNFRHEPEMSHLPTIEVLLGSIISKYFELAAQDDESSDVTEEQLKSIIYNGFAHAFLVNVNSACMFWLQSLSILAAFEQKSKFSPLVETFRTLELASSKLKKEKSKMVSYRFNLVSDKTGDTERFDLSLDEKCLGVPFCTLSGELKPAGTERPFPVSGFRVGHVVYFEIPFRKAKLLMGGVRDVNDDLHMRYIAVELDAPLSDSSKLFEINPDVGDTGTGTGNQTLVTESRTRWSQNN